MKINPEIKFRADQLKKHIGLFYSEVEHMLAGILSERKISRISFEDLFDPSLNDMAYGGFKVFIQRYNTHENVYEPYFVTGIRLEGGSLIVEYQNDNDSSDTEEHAADFLPAFDLYELYTYLCTFFSWLDTGELVSRTEKDSDMEGWHTVELHSADEAEENE